MSNSAGGSQIEEWPQTIKDQQLKNIEKNDKCANIYFF
jgi:hypothetical protein